MAPYIVPYSKGCAPCREFLVSTWSTIQAILWVAHRYLDEHLADGGAGLVGGAVHRHGLPVSGELQGEFLLHQLHDHLTDNTPLRKPANNQLWSTTPFNCSMVEVSVHTELQALALSILVRPLTSVSNAFIFSTRQVRAVSVASPTFSYTPLA